VVPPPQQQPFVVQQPQQSTPAQQNAEAPLAEHRQEQRATEEQPIVTDITAAYHAYKDNPIRFAREYQNRLFKGELPFHGAQVHSDETMVGFGGNIFPDAECLIPRGSDLERQAEDWHKGDMIKVSGRIEAMNMFGESVRLSSCRFE
jgi:hypothetical protein